MSQDTIDIAVRLASALAAGSLIGLERSVHGRPAGFRTHALVCLASALLMLVTAYQWEWLGVTAANEESFRTDPTRMAQGIMTGIGFLGAGVIFKEGLTVRGLTTAASIWITAAIGILYGVGFFYPAILGTLATLGTLAAFRWIETRIPTHIFAHHLLRFAKGKVMQEADVRNLLSERRRVRLPYGHQDSRPAKHAEAGREVPYCAGHPRVPHLADRRLADVCLWHKADYSTAPHRVR